MGIDALLPRNIASEGFDWILSHLTHELNASLTKRTFDVVPNADVLIFAHMATFLNIGVPNTDTFDSNHSLLPKTCDFARRLLDAAVNETNDGNLDPILREDEDLQTTYDSLSQCVLPQKEFKKRKVPMIGWTYSQSANEKKQHDGEEVDHNI